jgi:hypothetical protein
VGTTEASGKKGRKRRLPVGPTGLILGARGSLDEHRQTDRGKGYATGLAAPEKHLGGRGMRRRVQGDSMKGGRAGSYSCRALQARLRTRERAALAQELSGVVSPLGRVHVRQMLAQQ